MPSNSRFLFSAFVLATTASSVWAQATTEAKAEQPVVKQNASRDLGVGSTMVIRETAPAAPASAEKAQIWIYLHNGRRLYADEVSEGAEGIWYKLGNVSTFIDRARVDHVARMLIKSTLRADVDNSSGRWTIANAERVESFFMKKFARPLPLTAFGQSELHTRWGLDHRQGVDVGLHPDSAEGQALIAFLRRESIPFLAFRGAIPGVATGPHIHIGNASHRLP